MSKQWIWISTFGQTHQHIYSIYNESIHNLVTPYVHHVWGLFILGISGRKTGVFVVGSTKSHIVIQYTVL